MNLFLKNFSGQYVEIVANTGIVTQEGQAPLITHGFVIDVDTDFIYLGSNNAIQIDSAVNKKDVVFICITDPEEVPEMSDLENDEELN